MTWEEEETLTQEQQNSMNYYLYGRVTPELARSFGAADENQAVDLHLGYVTWYTATNRDKVGTESPTQVSVNLLQLTNRITIRLSGLQEPEKVSMEVTSANDRYSGLGKLLDVRGQSTPYSYPVAIERKANTYTGKPEPGCIAEYDGEVTGHVTTLSLASGHGSLLSIHQEGLSAPIYEADLVGLVLMAARKGAQHANLRCDHDFKVDLKVRRCPDCTEGYEVVWIKVNDWMVHSIDVELDRM